MSHAASRRHALAAGGVALLGAAAACSPRGAAGSAATGSSTSATGPRRTTHRYGAHDAQVAELWLPRGGRTPDRAAVLVHGGYWRAGYDRSLEDAVAGDLVDRGWAVWNVDYRGTGAGGGWPSTLVDVATAVDLLARVGPAHGLDVRRVAFVGHSAGGQLALWAAVRGQRRAGDPGGAPAVLPRAVVAQAGVDDLVAADREDLGGGATALLLGGHAADRPQRYALASPVARVPVGVPLLVVTGDADVNVPPTQSAAFAAAASAAGDDVDHVVVPGEDHFAHLDPSTRCWRTAREWLDRALPR